MSDEKKYKVLKSPLTLKRRIANPEEEFVETEFIGGSMAIGEAIAAGRCVEVKTDSKSEGKK